MIRIKENMYFINKHHKLNMFPQSKSFEIIRFISITIEIVNVTQPIIQTLEIMSDVCAKHLSIVLVESFPIMESRFLIQ